jgi:gluconolactonase
MQNRTGFSRRRMLELTAAAGATVLTRGTFAQTGPRIERFDRALDAIIDVSQPIKEIASGFGGNHGPTEGPLWWKEGSYLLFADISNDRLMKYTPGRGVSVFSEKSNRANGLTRDTHGRLVACETDTRRVTRIENDGSLTVVAGSFQGHPLNRPNDVVVKSDGACYFTDPGPPFATAGASDLGYSGVFRVSPDLGVISLLVNNFVLPNGLAFSPDEKTLYINDSNHNHIRAFDVQPNGLLSWYSDHVFADLSGSESGVVDGMKVDAAGNVYCGGAGGLYILDPKGKKLGRIVHGYSYTTNLAFGGEDWKTLYFTSLSQLGSVRLKIAGIPVPAANK